MKVLKISEHFLTLMGVCSHNPKDPQNEFFRSINSYIVFVVLLVSEFMSTTYLIKNYANTSSFSTSVFSLMQAVMFSCQIGSFLSIGVNMAKVKRLHNKLQDIVDAGIYRIYLFLIDTNHKKNIFDISAEKTKDFGIFKIVEDKDRFYTKWAVYSVCLADMGFVIVPSILHSFFCMWQGNFDTSKWFFASYLYVPFDLSIIFLWYLTLLFEGIIAANFSFVFATITSYFVSCCTYIEACCEHFQRHCRQIEQKMDYDLRKGHVISSDVREDIIFGIKYHIKIMEYVIITISYNYLFLDTHLKKYFFLQNY